MCGGRQSLSPGEVVLVWSRRQPLTSQERRPRFRVQPEEKEPATPSRSVQRCGRLGGLKLQCLAGGGPRKPERKRAMLQEELRLLPPVAAAAAEESATKLPWRPQARGRRREEWWPAH